MEKVPTNEKFNVLLLTSYCGDKNDINCSDDKPCIDCLSMCNIYKVDKDDLKEYVGTLDYLGS